MVKTIRHITARITALLVMALFFCMMCGFDSTGQKVYDDAGLLTSDQINRLEALCVSKAETSQIDLIIVTTDSTKGRSSMRYAEDFYMAHDFGYDKLHGDGALMLINMEEREVWISTSGKAIRYLSDTRIDNIVTAVTSKLSSGNYYDGCVAFINKTSDYMTYLPTSSDAGGSGMTTTGGEAASLSEKLLYAMPVKLGIAAAAAVLVVCILRMKNKSRMTVDSTSYMHDNQYDVNRRVDTYLRTSRVRHEKPKPSESSGGSSGGSSHSGSGGHTFGGGGGRF